MSHKTKLTMLACYYYYKSLGVMYANAAINTLIKNIKYASFSHF